MQKGEDSGRSSLQRKKTGSEGLTVDNGDGFVPWKIEFKTDPSASRQGKKNSSSGKKSNKGDYPDELERDDGETAAKKKKSKKSAVGEEELALRAEKARLLKEKVLRIISP